MFESHITITHPTAEYQWPIQFLEEFKEFCKSIPAKAVFVINDTGSEIDQLMTAKFHKGKDFAEVSREVDSIKEKLCLAGYAIIRTKIEYIGNTLPDQLKLIYEELHSKFIVDHSWELRRMKELIGEDAHTSINFLKQSTAKGDRFVFVTNRSKADHKKVIEKLRSNGYTLANTIHEKVIFDDLPSMDRNWESCGVCALKEVKL